MKKLAGKWLAAISGGPDSMALVDMCREKGMDIAAAHVNYHHRQQAEQAGLSGVCSTMPLMVW